MRQPVHAVFEAEITLKKCLPLGTNISWFCILSRVERDQERKNRMGKSFFMHISFSYIKKGGGGGFKIRYHHLFLEPASERNKLERWEWRHWKDPFLQIMNHIWFLKIRTKLTEQTSFKVKTRPYTRHKMRPHPASRHFRRFLQKRHGRTDGRTDGRTHPLIEMRGRI